MCHHDSKVFVCVNRGGDVTIVITELVESDDSVCDLRIPHAHELTVGLLRSLLARHDVWMLAHVVDSSDVIKSDLAIAIYIQLLVSLPNEAKSVLVQIPAKCHKELVKVDSPGVIPVKVGDENTALLFRKMNIEVLQSPHELIEIKLPVSIIVQDAENSAYAPNSHRSSSLQRLLNVCDHLGALISGRGFDGLCSRSILRQLNHPKVLAIHTLVIVLTDSLTVVLASEHLSLVLSGSGHARDFHLVAEVIPVRDAVV